MTLTKKIDSWIPKSGERVKVIGNQASGNKPDCSTQELVNGDEIVIYRVEVKRGLAYYKVNIGGGKMYDNCMYLIDLEPIITVTVKSDTKCLCNIISLMNNGCKCGAILREQGVKNE